MRTLQRAMTATQKGELRSDWIESDEDGGGRAGAPSATGFAAGIQMGQDLALEEILHKLVSMEDTDEWFRQRCITVRARVHKVIGGMVSNCAHWETPINIPVLVAYTMWQISRSLSWREQRLAVPPGAVELLREWVADRAWFLWREFDKRALNGAASARIASQRRAAVATSDGWRRRAPSSVSPSRYTWEDHCIVTVYTSAMGVCWEGTAKWAMRPVPWLSVFLQSSHELDRVFSGSTRVRMPKRAYTRGCRLWRAFFFLAFNGETSAAHADALHLVDAKFAARAATLGTRAHG
jgi:hypothetical protein